MEIPYAPPVDLLLAIGSPRQQKEWPNYLELGLSEEHILELIRLATDEDLYWAEGETDPLWGPQHAWRALGQLRAEAAIEPLIVLLREWEESDWVAEEIPVVLGMIGPKAIPSLTRHLAAEAGPDYDYSTIAYARSLECIGNRHPESRNECVTILTKQLRRFEAQDEALNGFLISFLIDLKAIESLPVVREAFERDCVDYFITGDIEDVEIELGVRKERSSPPDWKIVFEDRFAPKAATAPPPVLPGKIVPARTTPKVGRNDPCPCGSGKKYKKCCLGKPA